MGTRTRKPQAGKEAAKDRSSNAPAPPGARFLGESAEYRRARNKLLEAEIELRRATESVAKSRRGLPPGGVVPEDYLFEEAGKDGGARKVRLSELFAPGKSTLAVYSFMYGPEMKEACPSCTSMLDSMDGSAPHVRQRLNLVVVAKSPLPRILHHAKRRGWRHLRLLSSARNTYNRDYFGERPDGAQAPMLNVFVREDGKVRHFWGTELLFVPADKGQDMRHLDFIWPIWNLFDVTPEGRRAGRTGVDFPKLSYGD